MRKAKVYSVKAVLPRMSWSPRNLYNLLLRSTDNQLAKQTSLFASSKTMYQQRWLSKRLLRGYHGDHIPETRFKRWILPQELPTYASTAAADSQAGGGGGSKASSKASAGPSAVPRPGGILEAVVKESQQTNSKLPIASLFLRELERRLDTIVFRSCFARSVYEARSLVVQGKVRVNGTKNANPNELLNPGDLISVDPAAIPMLSEEAQRQADRRAAAALAAEKGETASATNETEEEQAPEGAAGSESEAPATSESSETIESGEGKAEAAAETESSQNDALKDEGAKAAEQKSPTQQSAKQSKDQLPPGVRRFHLPPFAAPSLFIPPYLEVSFMTCSAIYIRHPTLMRNRTRSGLPEKGAPNERDAVGYLSDLPTPYDPRGELFSMAWEHYTRNSPRVRGNLRRTKLTARVGRGFERARAKDAWQKAVAVRRGWIKRSSEDEKRLERDSAPSRPAIGAKKGGSFGGRPKRVPMRLMKKTKRSLGKK